MANQQNATTRYGIDVNAATNLAMSQNSSNASTTASQYGALGNVGTFTGLRYTTIIKIMGSSRGRHDQFVDLRNTNYGGTYGFYSN